MRSIILVTDGTPDNVVAAILTSRRQDHRGHNQNLQNYSRSSQPSSRIPNADKEMGADVIIFREGWRNGARAHHDARQF